MSSDTRQETTDFLPFVDPLLDDSTRASLLAQVHAERPSDHTTTLHPSISTSYTPTYPPSLASQHTALEAGDDLASTRTDGQGIDLTRYEQDALASPTDTTDTTEWRTTLRRAHASATYLSGRTTSLALLETYGKNAWLVSNWQLEAEVTALDAELAVARQEAEALGEERERAQRAGAAEMVALEERWKRGVGEVVEVQVATEGLRREVLELRREVAAGT